MSDSSNLDGSGGVSGEEVVTDAAGGMFTARPRVASYAGALGLAIAIGSMLI